ncbi:Rho termination factor N-terminal domain-containing protein, partial [Agromyces agglutinans]
MTNAPESLVGAVTPARLSAMKVAELVELANSLGIPGASKRRKGELVELISTAQAGETAAAEAPVEAPAPAEAVAEASESAEATAPAEPAAAPAEAAAEPAAPAEP